MSDDVRCSADLTAITIEPNNTDPPPEHHAEASPLTREEIKKNPDLLIPIYQQGNFGVQLGKIKHEKVIKTSKILVATGVLYILLTIIAVSTFSKLGRSPLLLHSGWLIVILSIAGGVACYWFANTLHELVKPLSTLMLLRYFMIFVFICALLVMFLHLLCTAVAFGKDTPKGFVKYLAGTASTILTILDFIVMWGTLGSINKQSENVLDKCCCCLGFVTGDELAPGVPDPLFVKNMVAFAKGLKTVSGALD